MPEELPEEMIEKGTHLHHEVGPVMPEFFGEERGVRFKREATKRSVRTALGAKRAEEITPAIEKLKSAPLQEILRRQLATTEQELKTPEGPQILLKRNELLRDLIAKGELEEGERKIADKLIDANARLLEKFEKVPVELPKKEVGLEAAISRHDRLQAEIRKLEADLGKLKEEETEERLRIQAELVRKLKEQEEEAKGIVSLGGLEAISGLGGIEMPPGIEEIGEDGFKEWFKQRLSLLEEEYPDQSFDTNWRLVYPLEVALSSLLPKHGEKDKYGVFRKELTLELESRRNRHNYVYLHRRIAGTGELIGASVLLATPYIEHLIHNPEVAEALRKLESLGERHLATGNKERRGELRNEMLDLIKKNGSPYLIAAGVYSATAEAGRHDVILNDSGDFFLGRVFNLPIRARQFWHDRMDRPEFEELYRALDLKASNFWHVILNGYRGRLFGETTDNPQAAQEFRELCEKYKIKDIEYSGDENKKDSKIIGFSLREADFEHLPLTDPEGFNLPRDQIKLCYLNISDADEIRKAILNPGGLLELPNLTRLRAISDELKHLKGREKYEWLREVARATIDFWKDRSAPWIEENYPEKMRNSFSKKVFPAVAAWTNPRIEMEIKALPPIIRAEDVGWLLDQTIGPRSQREMKKGARTAGNVLLGIIEGLGKHIFKTIFRGK